MRFYRELIRHYSKTECRCKSECKSRVTKFQKHLSFCFG